MDNFSWISGKHSFRFGGDGATTSSCRSATNLPAAASQLTAVSPANANTLAGGYTGADFLLGVFQHIESAVALAKGDFRNHEWALYIDDTYKLTPRIDNEFGASVGGRSTAAGQFRTPTQFSVQAAAPVLCRRARRQQASRLVRTGTGDFYEGLAFRFTGPVQLARDGRLGNRLIKTDYNNFAPRTGHRL